MDAGEPNAKWLGVSAVYVVRLQQAGCAPRVPHVVRGDDEFETCTLMTGMNRAKHS